MKFDLKKGKGIGAKDFFEGEWYKDGVRQLCADGWPTFMVPVNIKVNELIEENKTMKEKLRIAVEALKNINREEINSQRPGGSYSRSAKLSFDALKKIENDNSNNQ